MSEFGHNRREFLAQLSGAIGVALVADSTALTDLALSARGSGAIPHGYRFDRVFTVGGKGRSFDGIAEILPGVNITDDSVIFLARKENGNRAAYRLQIGRHGRPRRARPVKIVENGDVLPDGITVEHISHGESNRNGLWATVIRSPEGVNGLYTQRPGKPLQRVFGLGDPAPGGGYFSGSFGAIDIDDDGSILFVSRFTREGEAHQGLFFVSRNRKKGRLLIETGHRIPHSKALVTGFGLVERRGNHYILQVYGRRFRHRARRDFKTEPSGFISGPIGKGRHGARLLVGSQRLKPVRGVIRADGWVAPRVHHDGTAGTVAHQTGKHLQLHRHHPNRRSASKLSRTGSRTRHGSKVVTISAPVFDRNGLFYYRVMSKRAAELYVVDDRERRLILASGDRVDGAKIKAFSFGSHPEETDHRGRLAFQAHINDDRTTIVVAAPH